MNNSGSFFMGSYTNIFQSCKFLSNSEARSSYLPNLGLNPSFFFRVEANLLSGVMATKFDNMGFVTSVSAQKFLEEQKKSKKEESLKRRRSTSRDRRSRSRDRRSRSRDRRSRSRDRRSRSRDRRGRDHRSRERRVSRSRSRERRHRSKTPQTNVEVEIPQDLKEIPST